MKRRLRTLLVIIAVLAVFQIVAGALLLSWTVTTEKSYTYVTATITEIQTEKQQNEDGDEYYTVKSISVAYTNNSGESVVATLADFPYSFELGTVLECRYTDNPLSLSTQTTDWFTPVFTIVLGVVYAIGGTLLFVFRKNFGLYALEDTEKGDFEEEEDDWELDDEQSNEILQDDDPENYN